MDIEAIMEATIVAHDRVERFCVSLDDDTLQRDSLLPGWSVAHTLSHIAFNAEALVLVAEGLTRGEVGVMYPHGVDGRNGDIEAGSARSGDEIVAHLERSARSFEQAWRRVLDEGLEHDAEMSVLPDSPTFDAASVTYRRLKEVDVHQSDCGLPGFFYTDWSDALVNNGLVLELESVAERLGHPIQVADEFGAHYLLGEGAADLDAIDSTRHDLMAWSLNRATPAELPEIGPWQ